MGGREKTLSYPTFPPSAFASALHLPIGIATLPPSHLTDLSTIRLHMPCVLSRRPHITAATAIVSHAAVPRIATAYGAATVSACNVTSR
eukprot:CAMPEP_0174751794 /NCGR_PEP_ID=MMETSP1094-20130205/100602_1 /TAXON_ID=156173 /ORGANISM="Chrysochromulina brevifilum, Strain UTEX LB 985" /LENGTH=88 /DNA_ID=CAMNT_0015957333 /DNA_START=146 /DNA_END=408 /DNA_ORIENTATION=+